MPSDFRRAEKPLTQLRRPLTDRELDGSIAREAGLVPRRTLQVPRRYFAERAADPTSIYHVWPSPSQHHPLPRRRPPQAT